MAAIGLDVQQVVDDVGRRSGQREAAEGQQRGRAAWLSVKRVRQQQRHKDEQVLGPLVQAHGLEQRLQGMRALIELVRGPDAARLQACMRKPEARIGHHGSAGVSQQRQIGRVVADVIECAGAKAAQPRAFLFR